MAFLAIFFKGRTRKVKISFFAPFTLDKMVDLWYISMWVRLGTRVRGKLILRRKVHGRNPCYGDFKKDF